MAAVHTPRPWPARLQSLATHAVSGIGLFAGALFVAEISY
ncbi:hypothetical protein CQ393_00025 [Stenotrophomonas sp. MYb238]|nr:hypothetical protein [Stenotrophomonas sp. MYb238]